MCCSAFDDASVKFIDKCQLLRSPSTCWIMVLLASPLPERRHTRASMSRMGTFCGGTVGNFIALDFTLLSSCKAWALLSRLQDA